MDFTAKSPRASDPMPQQRAMMQLLFLLAFTGNVVLVLAAPLPMQRDLPSSSLRRSSPAAVHKVSGLVVNAARSTVSSLIHVLSEAAARPFRHHRQLQPPRAFRHLSTALRTKWRVAARQQSATAGNSSFSPGIIALIAVASALFLVGPIFFCFFCGCCSCSKVKERREARREADEKRFQESDEKSTVSRKSKLDCRLSEVGPVQVRPDLNGNHAWTATQGDEVSMFRNPPAQAGAEGNV